MTITFKAVAIAALGVALAACAEPTPDTLAGPSLKPGNGNGGGGGPGGGGETALLADFLAGSDVLNDSTNYLDGDAGVTAHITADGSLSFIATDPRGFDIGDINGIDSTGDTTLLVSGPGVVEARFQTFSCCDLRAMTTDSAGVQLNGNPIHMKLLLVWLAENGDYKLSFGSSSCGSGSMPSDDPLRGSWALVTMDTVTSAPDTTWTIENDTTGSGTLCQFFNHQGRQNDSTHVWSTDVVTGVKFAVTSQ